MKKELMLVTDECALPVEDVIVIMKYDEEFFNQRTGILEKVYNVQVMLDKQPTAINITCHTKEEQENLFNILMERR